MAPKRASVPGQIHPFVWIVVAVNTAVLGAALLLQPLTVPLSALALLVTLALPFVLRREPAAKSETAVATAAGTEPERYELRGLLASGAMGEVWLARHRQLGRDVALKRIKPGIIDEDDTRRFEREARVLSALRSPHTVEVFDFGIQTDGDLYYAMELLDGIDLQNVVSEYGPLPPERVVYLLLQACASFHEAHEQGLVHRDVKPANFMTCRYGGQLDFLKVLDFGFVKKPPSRTSLAGITRAATVLGTPAYVAPESLNGSKFVDCRADLYALGAVGFWLLTGRLLFDHTQPMAMVQAHLIEAPPKASQHSRFSVPAALDTLLFECLAKNPTDRPQTAAAIRTRLEQVPLGEPWNQERAAAWWSERPPTKAARAIARGTA